MRALLYRSAIAGLVVGLVLLPSRGTGQPRLGQSAALQGFLPGAQQLFLLDLANTPVGEIPTNIKLLQGTLEVVLKDGVPMLRASSASAFLITLPQPLPQDFTLEFDLVPKACCNPADLGIGEVNQGAASAHLEWDSDGQLRAVGGGGELYQAPMPEDFRAALPGVLTKVGVSFAGPTVKLYTNGRRLFTLDRQFARKPELRIALGGINDGTGAVYLAGLRIATGGPLIGIVQTTPQPGPRSGTPSTAPPAPGGASNQAASRSPASTGTPVPTVVANVTVTQGPAGPVVSWLAVAAPATYTVQRWKIDDQTCCNNASSRLPGPPWQDVPPPLPGTYVYQVTVTTNAGTATGQAQFGYFQQGGQIANTGLAPSPSSGPRTVTSTTTTPTATAPTAAGGAVPSGFTVTVSMAPQGPVVSWPRVPNATGYTVTRSKSDDLNCCNTSSGRTWGATSPWQDAPLPMPGTYVYTVLANTTLGQMQAQTQYTLSAPVTAVLATPSTTGTATPMPAPPPPPAPAPTGGTLLGPTRPAGTSPTNTGAPPNNLRANPSPVTVTLDWTPPGTGWLTPPPATYEVRRAIKGTTGSAWTLLTPTPITEWGYVDAPPDRTQTYTYEVSAIDPSGARGAATVDATLKPPVDPAWISARAIGPDEVELTWMSGLPDVKDYFISGPGTGNGMIVTATLTGGAHHWLYTLKGIPSGTHTWTVAANYQPGGILTPASQWPKATLSMAASGNYEISIESVLASSPAVDDLFNGDGMGNEVYLTALVRVKDQAGTVLSETSHRSATHGDVSNWPTRARAGKGMPDGGIYSGDLITPIWDRPAPGATGWSRFVLWSGTLTAGGKAVEIAPAVWESDDIWNRGTPPVAYDDLLRQVGYGLLDLNARTPYGEISNVMLANEGTGGFIGWRIMTPEDRPIGIAKTQDPLNDAASWYPFGVKIDQSIAEAALGGSYGSPGLISIVIADHKILSRHTFTHPDLGMGRYTLNIRITRLP